MKINILFELREGPWGGGNQFLKALKNEFKEQRVYVEDPERADVILFNSYPFGYEHLFSQVFSLKQKQSDKIIILRIDGPVSLIRGQGKEIDRISARFNNVFADGIVFQSNWCREQNKKYFNIASKYETLIYNASDNNTFNKHNKKPFDPKQRVKVIASSWSPNWRKGFDVYKYLDENLDFSKYDMTFIGNSPIVFKNIKHTEPVPTQTLAEVLKKHDVYITASRNDPCSNALIEAMSCGLPAVASNDGGHPELIGQGGETFNRKGDVLASIEKVVKDYNNYQNRISEFSIEKAAQHYYDFSQKIYNDVQYKKYKPKQVNLSVKMNNYIIKIMILEWKVLITLKKVLAAWKKQIGFLN